MARRLDDLKIICVLLRQHVGYDVFIVVEYVCIEIQKLIVHSEGQNLRLHAYAVPSH